MGYSIRKATASDAAGILQLVTELAVFEKEPNAVLTSLDDIREAGWGTNPQFEAVVALDGTSYVGLALWYTRWSTWKGTTLHLEDLIVTQDRRGEGIGVALYKTYLKRAQELKVRRAEWVVLDWNQGAIDFYKASGATVLDDWNIVQMDDTAINNYLS